MEECKAASVICILSFSCLFDIDSFAVPNKLIITGFITGIIFSVIQYGGIGVLKILPSMLLPVVLLFFLFKIRVLGAADIKLFAMLGSFYEWKFVIKCMIMAFLAAGLISLWKILRQRELRKRMIHVIEFIIHGLRHGKFGVYTSVNATLEDNVINFSISILIGYLVVLLCGG